MTNDHILEIRKFYMGLLDKPTLKDSIFHQAHCEEMVALCNLAIARAEGLPAEPNHAMLKALAGDPALLAASDEAELRARYHEMRRRVGPDAAWEDYKQRAAAAEDKPK